MAWMNEAEIDDAVNVLARTPLGAYARYLSDWRDIVNSNSDGWAYWRGGTRPAAGLCAVVERGLRAARYGDTPMPTEAEARKTLGPITRAANKHKLPLPARPA